MSIDTESVVDTRPRGQLHEDGSHYVVSGHLSDEELMRLDDPVLQAALTGDSWDFGSDAELSGSPESLLIGPIPVYPVTMRDLKPRHGYRRVKGDLGEDHVPVTILQLPAPLAGMMAAVAAHATERRISYAWSWFLEAQAKQVSEELAKAIGSEFRKNSFPGFWGHLNTHPQVGPLQVGVHPADHEEYKQYLHGRGLISQDELEDPEFGVVPLVQRDPVVAVGAIQQLEVVLLSDVTRGHLYGHWATVQFGFCGDTDGDAVGMLVPPCFLRARAVQPSVAYPDLQIMERSPETLLDRLAGSIKTLSHREKAQKVVGAMVRQELTGIVTHVWHLQAQLYQRARLARLGADAPLRIRLDVSREAYIEAFAPFNEVSEGIFDLGKAKTPEAQSESIQQAGAIASVFEGWLEDGTIEQPRLLEALAPFVSEKALGQFRVIVETAGTTISSIQGTASGRILSAGSKETAIAAALREVIPQMRGRESARRLQWLLACQRGAAVLPIHVGERSERMPHQDDLTLDLGVRGMEGVLAGVRHQGEPVFSQIRASVDAKGQNRITALMHPAWVWKTVKPGSTPPDPFAWAITLDLPKVTPLGQHGHKLFTWKSGAALVYQPRIVVNSDGTYRKENSREFLAAVAFEVVQGLAKRRELRYGSEATVLRVNEAFRKGIRDGIGKLPRTTTEANRETAATEFPVVYPEAVGVGAKLALAETVLTRLSEEGYDVLTTSKSKPGTTIALAGQHGCPDYVAGIFPLERWGQPSPKRKGENRGLRQAQRLAHPTPLGDLLTYPGVSAPTWLTDRVVRVRTAALDLYGLNVWLVGTEIEGHDTFIMTHVGHEQTALAETSWMCADPLALEEHLQGLAAEGFTETDYKVTEELTEIGQGVFTTAYRVVVTHPEGLLDAGKTKSMSLVKGVQTVLPERFQLSTRNPDGTWRAIGAVVSQKTLEGKAGFNAAALMVGYEAGLPSIDPAHTPEQHLEACREGFRKQGLRKDFVQDIYLLEVGQEPRFIGRGVVGDLPYYRAPQTTRSTAKFRDVNVGYHAQIMAGIRPEGPRWEAAVRRFDERAAVLDRLLDLSATVKAFVKANPQDRTRKARAVDGGPGKRVAMVVRRELTRRFTEELKALPPAERAARGVEQASAWARINEVIDRWLAAVDPGTPPEVAYAELKALVVSGE